MTVTLEQLDAYLGGEDGHSFTDEELQGALDAETAAQAARCRLPDPVSADPVSADLDEALKRRCARNLAMRRIPLAVPQGDAESGPTIIPGNDPEVRRLEAPYRKRKVG